MKTKVIVMKTKISVIVPVYNPAIKVGKYVKRFVKKIIVYDLFSRNIKGYLLQEI